MSFFLLLPFSIILLQVNAKAESSLCPCDIGRSWNDIMILADSSDVMGDMFKELSKLIKMSLGGAKIGRQSYETQVGVVTYSGQANMSAQLDKYNNTLDFIIDGWPYLGGQDTNIYDALVLAMDELHSIRNRPKSRKLIILGASTYRMGNYPDPIQQAETFKRNQGSIIVIAYGDIHGYARQVLQNISSPEMFLNATLNAFNYTTLIKEMICNANCFCPSSYFPVGQQGETLPTLACYWDSTLQILGVLVNRSCTDINMHSGMPAMPDSLVKQQALVGGSSQNLTKPAFFIGLNRAADGTWFWADGKEYEGPPPLGTGDCAVLKQGLGFNMIINATDCHESHYYSCQVKPCSTNNYCQ